MAIDAEVSAGRWLGRAEWIRRPGVCPHWRPRSSPIRWWPNRFIVEGRVRLWPGVSLAARADTLQFSDLTGSSRPRCRGRRRSAGSRAAVTYAITRNIGAKVAWQQNRRDGGRVRHDSAAGGATRVLVLTMTAASRGPGLELAILAVAAVAAASAGGRATAQATDRPGGIRGRLVLTQAPRRNERRPEVSEPGRRGFRERADRRAGVVYLDQAPRGAFDEPVRERAVMDQRNERFVPHLLAVTVGTRRRVPEQRPARITTCSPSPAPSASTSAATPPASRRAS